MKSVDEEVTEAIDALHFLWSSAIARGDVNAALDLLTADYALWTPSAALVTRDALRSSLSAAVQRCEIASEFERDELLVSDDLAIERGWDVQRVCNRATGETQGQRQYVFLVLQRGGDSGWRFARAIGQPGPNS